MFQSIIIGNLGADAEVRDSNGQKFVSLSIAETRKLKKADGSTQSVTNWIDAIISNVNHPVLPFLKQGVKVCVIGSTSLRLYSSKKDRMMKCGATVHVDSIELCGGIADEVPRQLIVPETGQIIEIQKFYWGQFDNSKMKKNDIRVLVDAKGRQYNMSKDGFIVPPPSQEQGAEEKSEEQEEKK